MRHYEVVMLVHPDQSGQLDSLVESYQNTIMEAGGRVHRLENWGRRQLAYEIEGVHKAHYVMMNIECNQEVADQLKTSFRYNDSVIRDLFIRKDKAITEASPMMREASQDAPPARGPRSGHDKDKAASDAASNE